MPQAFYGHNEYTKPSLALTCHRCQINNRGEVDVKATRISRYQFRRTYMDAYHSHLHRVGINGAVVHYDEHIFGSDTDSFNPDRWIEGYDVRVDKTMIIGRNVSAVLCIWTFACRLYKLVPQIDGRRTTIGLTSRPTSTSLSKNGRTGRTRYRTPSTLCSCAITEKIGKVRPNS